MAEFPSWFNPAAFALYPDIEGDPVAYASLVEFDPAPGSAVQPWPFLVNPERLSTAFGSEWVAQPTFATPDPTQYFSHNAERTYTLSGVKLFGWLAGVRLDVAIDALRLLTLADPANGRYAPPSLAFVWGDRIISPVALRSVTVEETGWRRGLASDAELTIVLLQLPAPEVIADASAPAIDDALRLTPRQQNDGLSAAADWLTENVGIVEPAIGDVVRSGDLSLSIEPATGAISTTDGAAVGTWDGRGFEPALTPTAQQ